MPEKFAVRSEPILKADNGFDRISFGTSLFTEQSSKLNVKLQ